MSWRAYQSVFNSDVFATTTSRRMPSTSCAYHNGKVSLSPTVTSTPYGSTELRRSTATSRVDLCVERGAVDQLPTSGTKASNTSGDATSQLRISLRRSAGRAEAASSAIDSQTYIN